MLRRLYPGLVHYGITTLGSTDVLRYLGRPVRLDGEVLKSFRGEVSSDLKWREEGVRIKHSVNGNSVKLYDKAFTAVGSVLRAETTIHHGGEFRVYRRKEGIAKGRNRGVSCGVGWQICTAVQRFPNEQQSAIWMRWPVWTNRPPYNACSPRKNEGLRRQISGVLAGFAALLQFFPRVYTHLHVGQDVWQADIQGLQQITTGRIRPGDAQATATAFAFHFR